MNSERLRRSVAWTLALLMGASLALPARAGLTRTQTITLQRGWNAVHLQVTPSNSDASAVFSNTPVTIAATYYSKSKPVQYIQNPSATAWSQQGWGVWYAPSRPDAFLTTLHAMRGNTTYLLYAQQDFTWVVTGAVTFAPVRWRGSSYNLVGFSLDEQSPPTFDQFFSASAAHTPCKAYRLVNNQWTLVTDPVRTTMRSGEACWIYCNGGSDYQGPLNVQLNAGRAVNFDASPEATIALANRSGNPITVQIQTGSSDSPLPLAYIIRGVTTGQMAKLSVDLPANYTLPTLEPGDNTSFWLTVRRERMTLSSQSALLKIVADPGVQYWIPLSATRPDLTVSGGGVQQSSQAINRRNNGF
jgi:hypothetical protein